jgi:predicted phosphoadenosine phosphosulfate sulfurtransferase
MYFDQHKPEKKKEKEKNFKRWISHDIKPLPMEVVRLYERKINFFFQFYQARIFVINISKILYFFSSNPSKLNC